MSEMTGRERMEATLRWAEPDRPPHFEIMFELEREAFGMQFPDRSAWDGMTANQKDAAVDLCMEIYAKIIDRFKWDALAVYWPWCDPDGVAAAVKNFSSEVLVGGIVGGGVVSIEHIDDWNEFAVQLMERPEEVHAQAEQRCRTALEKIDRLIDAGAEFIHTPNDIAFNAGPYISPAQIAEFVTPYWRRQVERIKDRGAYAIVHTDGQVMPILDQLVSLGADVFQSVDPMAGVDIAEVRKRTKGKLGLMGNVQCNLLQDGPKEAIRESALYCLEHASPGGGYIFGTSNTIFPGMPLEHYEYMLEVFGEFNATRAKS